MKKSHVVLIILSSLLLIAAATAIVYWPLMLIQQGLTEVSESDEVTTTDTTIPVPTEPQFRCPLDGEPADEARGMRRRPLAVMIENHVEARPQSGLSQACVVYETVAEGGITRFMAVFLHNDADNIGPVRSAREYFVDLAKQYEALYAHCGGPATVYGVIKSLGIADLDEFANEEAYWRVKDRRAPHNLYTATDKLWAKATSRGYEGDVFYQKPNFKDDEPEQARPATAAIDIAFSRQQFSVRYEYDQVANAYKRFMGGAPHVDSATGIHIAPKNVVVQYVPISRIADDPKGRMRVSLVGTGQAIVFQDGKALQATWQRPTIADLTRYYDATGAEIKFNRGQTWIELVDPSSMQVSHQ